jgi:FAD/FMN-containing dehydrogenase
VAAFPAVSASLLDELRGIAGTAAVNADHKQLQLWSRDHYWFSPVLKPELDEKAGEVSVTPATVDALRSVIACAFRHGVPITLRGAGTGNYGQGVPLFGGILLDLRALNTILETTPGHMRVSCGAKLLDMERAANKIGAELRFYPSTLTTATAGGFLAGGSGGIGSVTYGTLWDDGNVLGATIMTIEAEPRLIRADSAEALAGVIHNCGLTCVIVDLTLALAPKRNWEEFALSFQTFDSAYQFAESLAQDDAIHKRLVTVLEWPIPSYFKQLVKNGVVQDGQALVLLELAGVDSTTLAERATAHGGDIVLHTPPGRYHAGGMMLSDYTWNHTTLWAIKHDEQLTYLQDMFEPGRTLEQHHARKARYGDAVFSHIEFMRFRGRLVPQGLSIVRFESKQQLWELINWCESIGMWIANPHTHRLDEDVRWNGQPILDAKARWDPKGLLNPGHLAEN